MERLFHLMRRKDPEGTSTQAPGSENGDGLVGSKSDDDKATVTQSDDRISNVDSERGDEMNRCEEEMVNLTSDSFDCLASSSRRTSQADLSFYSASRRDSQSEYSSISASRRNSQSEYSSAYTSRKNSQSDFSVPFGSRRSSQSDFTSAATSRRSSRSEMTFGSGFGKLEPSSRKCFPMSDSPYRRFDLQFIAHAVETSDFYVKVISLLALSSSSATKGD